MVTVGAPIDGTVTGLSQLTVPGVVRAIAPLSDRLGGDGWGGAEGGGWIAAIRSTGSCAKGAKWWRPPLE